MKQGKKGGNNAKKDWKRKRGGWVLIHCQLRGIFLVTENKKGRKRRFSKKKKKKEAPNEGAK